MSNLPFTMRELLEAGVHFGHHTRRRNPKMAPYIYGVRDNVHIINLEKTVPMLACALQALQDRVANGGRVLFVGTKMQASEKLAEAAKRCGQYYVNHRWLGGTLTNWRTISQSIGKLQRLEEKLQEEDSGLTKKELLSIEAQRVKLTRVLGGIREMGGVPDMLIIIDILLEKTALQEALRLNIPTIGICDTNADPTDVTYPVPGNDDSSRAISLYCDLFARAVLQGMRESLVLAGVDVGEMENPPVDVSSEDASTPLTEGLYNEEPFEERTIEGEMVEEEAIMQKEA
ncbi:MAG: 30S ribosomal protein S2 [Holosporales bacterium]|jgi:small subunit ribosomal protein S2|nr:30S ribosomal protein S2 [Holosporales bacterium]